MKKEKKECSNCDSCKRYQEQAFELEVDEDLYQERLNRFWQRYHVLVYGFVIFILAVTAGWQIYHAWRMKIRLAESDMFENAVLQIFAQKPEIGRPALVKLAEDGRTGYKYLARLELAGLAARQNDVSGALLELKKLMDSTAPQELRTIALLSYIGYQVDTADPKKMLDLLKPHMQDQAFLEPVAELAIVVYVRDNNQKEASSLLKKMLATPNLPEQTSVKLNNLYQMIEQE